MFTFLDMLPHTLTGVWTVTLRLCLQTCRLLVVCLAGKKKRERERERKKKNERKLDSFSNVRKYKKYLKKERKKKKDKKKAGQSQ